MIWKEAMVNYTERELLRVAKRFHNTRRPYLLVNPLQAKHLPVSPAASLAMMEALGERLAERYPAARLVIGFAETATAIGAVAASCLGPSCRYVHTTRERLAAPEDWILFREEHSHAVEQRLTSARLGDWIAGTEQVLLVDDEISTGKTLLNMTAQLRRVFPALASKTLVAASLLNRVSPENLEKLEAQGIRCEYLVKLPQADYAAGVADIAIREAPPAVPIPLEASPLPGRWDPLPDPRTGVAIGSYTRCCRAMTEEAAAVLERYLPPRASLLILGTEEFMYPPLLLGQALEKGSGSFSVACHATTRSPIGISRETGYPITSGWKLRSFFDPDRDTYLYNLAPYDAAVAVSDTPRGDLQALESLAGALPGLDACQLFYLRPGGGLWRVRPRR